MNELSPALDALYHGDDANAAALLPTEPDVFEAAAFGRVERLKQLVADEPALVRARAADDFTPLHLAVFFGRAQAAKVLIAADADVTAASSNSFVERVQPLHSAAAGRDLESSRLLLDAGADVNAQQGGGFTPLMQAAQVGDLELTEAFLRAGANPSASRPDGTDAIALARAGGHVEIVERLAQAARVPTPRSRDDNDGT